MRSAFRKGVALLSEPESSAPGQGKSVEIPSKSASGYMQGIDGVPINVTELIPVFDKLMRKVTCDCHPTLSPLMRCRIFQRESTDNGLLKPKNIFNG